MASTARRLGLKVTKRWATLDLRDMDAAWPTYLAAQSIVVQQEYEVSTRDAMLYFLDLLSEANWPMPGEPLPRPWDQDHITALLRLAGPIYVKRLIKAGYDEQAAYLAALRRTVRQVVGEMYRETQQQVVDMSLWANEQHQTVVMQGYRRIAEPTACTFCRNLAGAANKYPVYRLTTKWVEPHPGCKCEVVPLPVYRTERILTARELAANKAMYEHIKKQKDRALARARAA